MLAQLMDSATVEQIREKEQIRIDAVQLSLSSSDPLEHTTINSLAIWRDTTVIPYNTVQYARDFLRGQLRYINDYEHAKWVSTGDAYTIDEIFAVSRRQNQHFGRFCVAGLIGAMALHSMNKSRQRKQVNKSYSCVYI